MKQSYVYILSNKWNNVLYIGVTSNLYKRIYEHKHGLIKGFTSKYNVHKLVYYEVFNRIEDAIYREKCIKKSSRKYKERLIKSLNEKWDDLYT